MTHDIEESYKIFLYCCNFFQGFAGLWRPTINLLLTIPPTLKHTHKNVMASVTKDDQHLARLILGNIL
jgi:hypothetical protein